MARNLFQVFHCLLSCCWIRLNGNTTLAAGRGHSVSGRLTMTCNNNVKQLSRNLTADGSYLVLWLLLKVMVEEARFLEQPAGRLAASHSNMADGSECGGCCCWSLCSDVMWSVRSTNGCTHLVGEMVMWMSCRKGICQRWVGHWWIIFQKEFLPLEFASRAPSTFTVLPSLL